MPSQSGIHPTSSRNRRIPESQTETVCLGATTGGSGMPFCKWKPLLLLILIITKITTPATTKPTTGKSHTSMESEPEFDGSVEETVTTVTTVGASTDMTVTVAPITDDSSEDADEVVPNREFALATPVVAVACVAVRTGSVAWETER